MVTEVGPNATVVQLFGPKAVKVIMPPAGLPAVVGLMTGVPGWLAVPVMVAVSLIALPSWTGPLAWVVSVGVTGFTVKHSLARLSDPSGTPFVMWTKSARQQYRPTDVRVAASERIGCVVVLLMVCVDPI